MKFKFTMSHYWWDNVHRFFGIETLSKITFPWVIGNIIFWGFFLKFTSQYQWDNEHKFAPFETLASAKLSYSSVHFNQRNLYAECCMFWMSRLQWDNEKRVIPLIGKTLFKGASHPVSVYFTTTGFECLNPNDTMKKNHCRCNVVLM